MQKNSQVIKFKARSKNLQLQEEGLVTQMVRRTLFKNASVVNLATGFAYFVDVLVENGVISKIENAGSITADPHTEEVDLKGGWVLPAFCNAFQDSSKCVNFEIGQDNPKLLELYRQLMRAKNVLSGVVDFEDDTKVCVLENMDEKDEIELSKVSNEIAENKKTVYLKVGQSLEELGTVDKTFKKALPYVLEDFGLLDRDFVLVGGNCLEKDDLTVFKQYGNKIVVCPSEDAQVGRRPTNLKTLKHLGFDIKIGSGTAFEVDYFAFMRQILMTQYGLFEDNTVLDESEVLLMATGGVAVLEVGKPADFLVVKNTQSIYFTILKMLVYGKSKKDVVMTVGKGKILQQNGRLENGLMIEEIVDKMIKLGSEENDN